MQLYAPPKSVVADPLAEASHRPRPVEVARAARMLWASLAIGVLNLLFQPGFVRPENWIGWITPAVAFAFLIVLVVAIAAGHNWARITFLVFFVVGTVPYLFVLQEIFAHSALFGVLSLGQAFLQLGAIFLLFFRPGSLWFGKTGRSATAG